jgi:hypothetical protein
MKILLTSLLALATAAPLAFAAVVSPPVQPSASAGGNSFNPVFSADGQKLVFVSHANNLVTNDDLGLWLDVFVRDIAGSNTVLVSVNTNGTGGANADANYPSASANGQFIAFSSRASNLVPDDTNDVTDIFVRDVNAGLTRLVSVDTNGNQSTGGANPHISADGRYVFFESAANNLTADSVSLGDVHLYRRDLWSNITVRASQSANANPSIVHELGSITPDGSFTAYSRGTNSIIPSTDAFVHQVGAGTTWVSVNVAGLLPGGYRCSPPVISDDGRYAAFYATPSAGGNTLALHHDTLTSTTLVISPAATNLSHGLQISANGQRVLFEYMDGIYARPAIWENTLGGIIAPIICDGFDLRGNPTMTPGGYAVAYIGCSNVYLASLTNTLVSASTNGSFSNGDYQFVAPAISADGARVAFAVTANDLVPGDLNGQSDIFLRDVNTGVTELITQAAPSKPATTAFAHSFLGPNSVSADGRFIVSTRYDDPSAWRDTNGAMDVFLSDKLLGTTHAVSIDTNLYASPQIGGYPGPGGLFYRSSTNSYANPIISADGTTVAATPPTFPFGPGVIYWARASNGAFGPFTIAHRAGTTLNSSTGNGSSYGPSLSSNGLEIAFTTTSTDFTYTNGTDNNVWPDVVLRRPDESNNVVNYLVSVTPGGVSGNNVSSNGIISPDGRWVIFESMASNLTADNTAGVLNLFARDLWSNTTHLVSSPISNSATVRFTGGTASFSGNSRYVCYATPIDFGFGFPPLVFVHDLVTRSNVTLPYNFSATGGVLSKPAINFNGDLVVFRYRLQFGQEILQVRDLTAGTSETLDSRILRNSLDAEPLISADGRYVVYRAKFPTWDFHTNQILVRDRLLGTTLIVSANGQGGAGNGPSTKPVLAANGRTVIFQSFASDLVAGDFNDKRDLFVLTLGGVDSEPDGMDDDWEMAYFETLSRDGTLDWDNDGATDLQEFLAGTDPKNDGSVFRVLTVAPAGGGAKTLLWSGNPTRSYRAEFKDDLGAASWTALTGSISWNGTTASINDPTAGSATNRYYRVVRLP